VETNPRIAIVGLGYVGLPLAVALAAHVPVTGYDIDAQRIAELTRGHDRTGEVEAARLAASALALTGDAARIQGHDIYIVTVPTPVDTRNEPDLRAVEGASLTVGRALAKGAIVVLESTVYPGVTEEVCGPILERASGLRCGVDFFLGYSPERINPGDREHTVERIVKVVAGQTPEVVETLARVYGAVNGGKIFRARSIRAAEAAKAIENAQRDINIAFINEVAGIVGRMGLSIYDVLDAAATKWNFLPFAPGLVGGHCIGVDPYYLARAARAVGVEPDVILAGRRINDEMAAQLAARIHAALKRKNARVLVLGLTFKENVPDLRNSKVADLVRALEGHGHGVSVHDPLADPAEALAEYGIRLLPRIAGAGPYDAPPYDAVVAAVPHKEYRALSADALAALLEPDGLVADIKGIWRTLALAPALRRWVL
jgi:UDP-N-acetyl-D-glucosamine/UDP-N-acetyl-D-galactosamine dehydrogenase